MAVTEIVRCVQAAASTSDAGQIITTPNLRGEIPKGVFIALTWADTNGVAASSAVINLGFASSAANQVNGEAVARNGFNFRESYLQTGSLIYFKNPDNGADFGQAELVEFIPNGMRINWTNLSSKAVLINCMFFGGDNVGVNVGPYSVNTGTPFPQAFNPKAVLTINGYGAGNNLNVPLTRYALGFAWTTDEAGIGGGNKNRHWNWNGPNAADPKQLAIVGTVQAIWRFVAPTFPPSDPLSDLPSLTNEVVVCDVPAAPIFSIIPVPSGGSFFEGLWMALGGLNTADIELPTPTSVGDETVSGLSFSPEAAIVMSTRLKSSRLPYNPNIATGNYEASSFGIGMWDEDGTQLFTGVTCTEGVPSGWDSECMTDLQVVNAPDEFGNTGADHQLSWLRRSNDGWVWTYKENDTTDSRIFSAIALGTSKGRLADETTPVGRIGGIEASGRIGGLAVHGQIGKTQPKGPSHAS